MSENEQNPRRMEPISADEWNRAFDGSPTMLVSHGWVDGRKNCGCVDCGGRYLGAAESYRCRGCAVLNFEASGDESDAMISSLRSLDMASPGAEMIRLLRMITVDQARRIKALENKP